MNIERLLNLFADAQNFPDQELKGSTVKMINLEFDQHATSDSGEIYKDEWLGFSS